MIKPDRHLGLLLRGLAMLNDAPVYDYDPRPALRYIHRIAGSAVGGYAGDAAEYASLKHWSFSTLWNLTFAYGDIDWCQLADYCAAWLQHLDGEAS